jgi:arsenite methyltransferase
MNRSNQNSAATKLNAQIWKSADNVHMHTIEQTVSSRYANAAAQREEALCCPVNYDPRYLKIIPEEVVEKDYGCGDPSRHVHPGETVLDLGSGAGKICFIAAQVVGPTGRVIGVDMTDAMLEVARRNAPIVAARLGYANVQFRKARIQDLTLDLEQPPGTARLQLGGNSQPALSTPGAAAAPLIQDNSIDVVVSNCVLNLVDPSAKQQLFRELHRVTKTTGRAVISDIIADRPVTPSLQNDPELWSGCISGALTLQEFVRGFEQAGFTNIEVLERGAEPWRVVQDIAFWSITIRASKTIPKIQSLPRLHLDIRKIPTKCC